MYDDDELGQDFSASMNENPSPSGVDDWGFWTGNNPIVPSVVAPEDDPSFPMGNDPAVWPNIVVDNPPPSSSWWGRNVNISAPATGQARQPSFMDRVINTIVGGSNPSGGYVSPGTYPMPGLARYNPLANLFPSRANAANPGAARSYYATNDSSSTWIFMFLIIAAVVVSIGAIILKK